MLIVNLFLLVFIVGHGEAKLKLLAFEVMDELMYMNITKVCYKEVGCFTTDAPFFSIPERPVPAPEDPALMKAYLEYYDRNESEDIKEISLSGELNFKHKSFDPSREFTIFIAGCYDDYNTTWQYDMKDALLQKLDVNVFVFGQHVKRKSNIQNISNLRGLGFQLARFIKHLQTDHGLMPSEKAWIIGFGCGAHMAGYTGSRVVLHRITGLDPANFLFEHAKESVVRLGRNNAIYVDVHHTDASNSNTQRGTGYVQPIGHVDFYYNGGFNQPGCPINKKITLIDDNSKNYNCDHDRAHVYFRQAILLQNDNLVIWGHNISTTNYIHSQSNDGKDGIRLILAALLRTQCNYDKCVPVGLDSPKSRQRGIKVVTTMPYEPWYNTVDQTDRERFGWLFFDEVVVRWMHSLAPESNYSDPPVPALPPLPPACYQSIWPWPFNWNLGCFNMSAPWVVLKSKPYSQPNPPGFLRITAWYYTRQNRYNKYVMALHPRTPYKVPNLPFNANKMTFVIIHGFYNSGKQEWIAPLKDGLLNLTDCNVIVADWGAGSVTLDYLQAAGNLRLAARTYSNMIQHLINHSQLNVTKLHLIGHSMGTHVAGFIGKSIPGIFQITALDPGQPWFEASDSITGITKNDASFVVGVHSDAPPFLPDLGFGLAREVGHVDFYINGGFKQPKCVAPTTELRAPNLTNVIDIMKPVQQIFVSLVLCPHQSAVDIFSEAISRRGCIFWGQAITMENMVASSHLSSDGDAWRAVYYKAGVNQDCTLHSCSPLGLDTYFWPARGTFVIITRSTNPYCIYDTHAKTIRDSQLTSPKAMLVLKHTDEFHPNVLSRNNRLSIIPFPYVIMYFLSADFTGLVAVLTDLFIRNLFEVFNVLLSWGAVPLQTFLIILWNKLDKLTKTQSVQQHHKILMEHVQKIEEENAKNITNGEKMGYAFGTSRISGKSPNRPY